MGILSNRGVQGPKKSNNQIVSQRANPTPGQVPTGATPESRDFLQGGLDIAKRRTNEIAGLQQQDNAFSGGVQGFSRLNDDPAIRRATTSRRAQTRDLRLARRQAIRRGDRLGAARIGQEAQSQGLGLHGIGRSGDIQKSVARDLLGGFAQASDTATSLLGQNQPAAATPLTPNQIFDQINNPVAGTPIPGSAAATGGTPAVPVTGTTKDPAADFNETAVFDPDGDRVGTPSNAGQRLGVASPVIPGSPTDAPELTDTFDPKNPLAFNPVPDVARIGDRINSPELEKFTGTLQERFMKSLKKDFLSEGASPRDPAGNLIDPNPTASVPGVDPSLAPQASPDIANAPFNVFGPQQQKQGIAPQVDSELTEEKFDEVDFTTPESIAAEKQAKIDAKASAETAEFEAAREQAKTRGVGAAIHLSEELGRSAFRGVEATKKLAAEAGAKAHEVVGKLTTAADRQVKTTSNDVAILAAKTRMDNATRQDTPENRKLIKAQSAIIKDLEEQNALIELKKKE